VGYAPSKEGDAASVAEGPAKVEHKLPRMALVDVTIIRTEEFKTDSRGINLLSGLQTTLSGTLLSYSRQKGHDNDGTRIDNESIGISPSLNLMDLEYNLNIFNQGSSKAEVLARPSLLAIENQTSKFFSGGTLHVQLSSSTSDGSLVDIPIGIHLSVTPQFYGDDTVKVAVRAERSFLEEGSENVGFPSFSQTSTTSVEATAVLKFGETLVLSGLSESEHDKSRDGVPILQSLPVVKYLFSRKEDLETKKSVLILLTPRKARYSKANAPGIDLEDDSVEAQTQHTANLKKENRIPRGNIDAAVRHLSRENRFYRQFRSGDLELDSWNNPDTVSGALRRVLGFL
jgi:type II secretory pathway component GspD/PulD (secretin)